MDMANQLIEQEDMIPPQPAGPVADSEFERRRMDLAVNLVDQYLAFVQHWQWGDSILEWIRQCETTFDTRVDLRNLLAQGYVPMLGPNGKTVYLVQSARSVLRYSKAFSLSA